jgi:acetyltransferase-like isoleucine patch superfamily enzyme
MIKTRKEGLKQEMKIGKNIAISKDVIVDVSGKIIIEDYVGISSGVNIFTHKHYWNHSQGIRSKIEKIVPVNLIICEDAFIGTNAMIISINRIGKGAVVGAGAVLTKDVGDFEIWAGNPAKKIGMRKKHKHKKNKGIKT